VIEMRTQTIVFLIIVLVSVPSIFLLNEASGKDVYPPGITTLLGESHPTQACDYCHSVLIPSRSERDQILGSCICHKEQYSPNGKVDMDLVSKGHDGKTCARCHTGMKLEDLDEDTYHLLHENVECRRCHEKRGVGFAIPEMKCDRCHTGGPHVIHGDKTAILCSACHGAYGEQFESGSRSAAVMPLTNATGKVAPRQHLTILKIIESLIGRYLGL